tara:strand:+ start:134 stop:682 length:549 start_codon:yes stop_codon:yes gene_type:complete
MKIKESFKADKFGFIDRSEDRDKRISIDDFDRKTIEAVEASGTYGKLILASFDYAVNKIIKLINYLFLGFFKDGFNGFKSHEDIKNEIKKEKIERLRILKGGAVIIRYKFMRYLITILMPPVGIFMSKGLYGWVNILLSIMLMYISYPIGIIYGMIISFNSYYSEYYQEMNEKEINEGTKTK